jgi:hypothetical protein
LCRNEHFSKLNSSIKEEFVDKANEIHNFKYDYSAVIYTRTNEKVKIICPIHGVFLQMPNKHLRGSGCHKCGFVAISESKKSYTGEFIFRANLIHNNYYDYSKVEYKLSNDKVKIICPKHGSFWQMARAHLQGSGCSICRPLFSEKEEEWLNSLGIVNDDKHRQVKIVLGSSYIIVDAFDPDTNTVYEFYGDYWHGNPQIFKSSDTNPSNKRLYGDLYKETIDREEMIRKHGYQIISIWEQEWNNRRLKIGSTK